MPPSSLLSRTRFAELLIACKPTLARFVTEADLNVLLKAFSEDDCQIGLS